MTIHAGLVSGWRGLSGRCEIIFAAGAVVSATVEIDSLAQLSRLMEKLEGVKDVHTVAREAS